MRNVQHLIGRQSYTAVEHKVGVYLATLTVRTTSKPPACHEEASYLIFRTSNPCSYTTRVSYQERSNDSYYSALLVR